MSMQTRQQGLSAIGLIITLALIGYGAFVGIQYVPQYIEYATVTTILDNVVEQNKQERFSDPDAVKSAIKNQLYMNQRNAVRENRHAGIGDGSQ
ncbi:MAG: DUF4845 domain-containing protein [Xanthomonadales bacterium]|nr:DUF4845 domain-containing protein [Xanthomonadales bacterium]